MPLHPTPLYSIAGNVVIGLVLMRLRVLGAADVLIIGLYLILSGIARFVEESYRAEPQTRVVAGLHLYQWLAIGQTLAGIVTTTLPGAAEGGRLRARRRRCWWPAPPRWRSWPARPWAWTSRLEPALLAAGRRRLTRVAPGTGRCVVQPRPLRMRFFMLF